MERGMKRSIIGAIAAFVLVLVGTGARADEKYYVWTYDYSTLASGSSEIEYYFTGVAADRQMSKKNDWQHQVELEYGITDHLDIGVYQIIEQPADDALHYAGYKARLRYRVAERNTFPLDIVLYAEHEEKIRGQNAFEGKLILAKDIGKLNLSYNQIYERTYSSGKGEHEYAVGISYQINPFFRIGVESKGSHTEGEYAAGPTIAWAGSRFWTNVGVLYGLNRRTNDREVRFVLGIPF